MRDSPLHPLGNLSRQRRFPFRLPKKQTQGRTSVAQSQPPRRYFSFSRTITALHSRNGSRDRNVTWLFGRVIIHREEARRSFRSRKRKKRPRQTCTARRPRDGILRRSLREPVSPARLFRLPEDTPKKHSPFPRNPFQVSNPNSPKSD